jgi:hypothetical protein
MALSPLTGSWFLNNTRAHCSRCHNCCEPSGGLAAHAAENRAASGESYPSRPMSFISPFLAGGGAERVIGPDLGAQSPLKENR